MASSSSVRVLIRKASNGSNNLLMNNKFLHYYRMLTMMMSSLVPSISTAGSSSFSMTIRSFNNHSTTRYHQYMADERTGRGCAEHAVGLPYRISNSNHDFGVIPGMDVITADYSSNGDDDKSFDYDEAIKMLGLGDDDVDENEDNDDRRDSDSQSSLVGKEVSDGSI